MPRVPRKWLKIARISADMTQAELAKASGTYASKICAYETGFSTPRPRLAKRIGTVLKFDWTQFYDDNANDTETTG